MCLLTFMHEGCTPDIIDLTNGAENNPDGFGFAVHAGTHIIHHSGLEFEPVLDMFLSVRAKHSGPALFHSRITTHGGTSLDNCHPFQVGRDTQTIMAHNGMLPIDGRDGKSDTRIFAEELFPSWGGAATLNSKRMRKKLAKFASGSKLVFLSANPDVQNDYTIINEGDGHWVDGVWWSNNSYKWARTSYTSTWTKHSSKAFGWSSDGEDWDGLNRYGSLWIPAGGVEDVTFTGHDGKEVWGEVWECLSCGHEEYVNEPALEAGMEYCPTCDSCWFCADHRDYCMCYHTFDGVVWESEDGIDTPTHPTLWGYDSAIKNGSIY